MNHRQQILSLYIVLKTFNNSLPSLRIFIHFLNFVIYKCKKTMKSKLILFICLLLIFPTTINAAKRKKVIRPKTPVVVEDPRFTSMLGSTARIVIADSTVTDSTKFMTAIQVNKEEGRIATYQDFFRKPGVGMVYVNELGNKCIYSKFDKELGYKYLFQSDLLSDGWTEGEPLAGINDDGQLFDLDYPYLMPDGITLYFAAKSSEGLGGYDIYRTRFDNDEGKYLAPENLGLPFNSDADDYSFVIDEQNQLAYFASNRRQPKGKTCVYCFIPTETRQVVTNSDETVVRSLARIDCIADTWTDKREVTAALQRKQNIYAEARSQSENNGKNPRFQFVINDQKTYTNMSDFRIPANRQRIKELLSMQKQRDDIMVVLDKTRSYYEEATQSERMSLKNDILESEQQLEAIERKIHQLEKTIRNTEN